METQVPAGLIDSIFRNFYVPPVIFGKCVPLPLVYALTSLAPVVHFSDDGGERRVCVDGKQRLTSIYRQVVTFRRCATRVDSFFVGLCIGRFIGGEVSLCPLVWMIRDTNGPADSL